MVKQEKKKGKKKAYKSLFLQTALRLYLPDFLGVAVHVQAIQLQESLNLEGLSSSHLSIFVTEKKLFTLMKCYNYFWLILALNKQRDDFVAI